VAESVALPPASIWNASMTLFDEVKNPAEDQG
jgi:hypothetical protein